MMNSKFKDLVEFHKSLTDNIINVLHDTKNIKKELGLNRDLTDVTSIEEIRENNKYLL